MIFPAMVVAHTSKRDYTHAMQDFSQALRLEPDHPSAFVGRGTVYMFEGEYDRAMEDLGEAIRLDPGNADAFDNRCWVHGLMNRSLDDGMSDCNESLRLRPNFADGLGARGPIYLRMAQRAQAIASCDAGLGRDPKSADTLYVRGIAKLRSGDIRGGENDIAAAKTLDLRIIETYRRFPGLQPPEHMFKQQDGQERQERQ